MILRILFFLAILLLLPAWGIDRMCLRRYLKWPLRALLFSPNIILLAALASVATSESYSTDAMYWKGLLLTWTLCLAVPEAKIALGMLVGAFFKRGSLGRRICYAVAWTWGGLTLLMMIYGFTKGYQRIQTVPYTYESSRLPEAFDGYRIVQFSDLHVGTYNGDTTVVRRIVDSINVCNPDLVVFTGDIVNTRAEELERFTKVLSGIRAADGVVAVMGNHDYAQYYRWKTPADSLLNIRYLEQQERDMGWRLLLNENIVLRRGDDSIAVVGVENHGRPPFPALADLGRAQQGLAPGCFKVLLSHDPSHWRSKVLPDTDIDLTLSGHTHGMQFRLGSFSPASWFYPDWGGEYRSEGNRVLYVSLGVGQVLLPFRFGAWPEVNLIELKTL